MSQDSWIGKIIGGRYAITELLGRGGMSSVYKAQDPNLRRVVAVKLIHPHLSNEPGFVRRFEEEAAAVASLRHPNIIQVYDFNNEGGTYYIVFEFIPGESLKDHLQRTHEAGRRLSYERTVDISTSVAEALHYAHERGMVHRDVKPANIMLDVQGDAILMDFGVVKIVGGETHTATGAVLGTARYISPEQIKGHSADGRTDIYSLGVTMFEMISGRPPFEADSALTLLMMHVNDPVPDIRQLRPDLPQDLITIINKALTKDRDQRFQNAAELASALRSARLDVHPHSKRAAMAASRIETKPDQPSVQPQSNQKITPANVSPSRPLQQAPPARPKGPQNKVAPAPERKSGKRSIALIGGIGAVILVILCLVAAALIYGMGLLDNDDQDVSGTETVVAATTSTHGEQASSTEAPIGQRPEDATSTSTQAASIETMQPSPTVQPSPTTGANPTTAASPTVAASPTTAVAPSPTHTPVPAGPFVRINSISIDGGYYVVDYTPTGYTPALPGTHIHFFWNTIPPENAGVGPTQETWYLYGGPNPFRGYGVNERPAGASQMCSLVANPDHTIQLNTGNCINLP